MFGPRRKCEDWRQKHYFIILQPIDGTWILPFALKVIKSKSFSFSFDKLVQMAVDLGFNPVGFVGDFEFRSIFNASFFTNCLVLYDIHHIFRRLLRKFPGNFPSFINKALKEGRTHTKNVKFS